MNYRCLASIILTVLLTTAACDNGTTSLDDGNEPEPSDSAMVPKELFTKKTRSAVINNGRIEAGLNANSEIGFSAGRIYFKSKSSTIGAISSIWIYAETDQPRIALSHYGPIESNLELTIPNSDLNPGIFSITADSIEYEITNWPTESGAPSEPDGQPRLLGDRMLWGYFTPLEDEADPDSPPPLSDLGVGVSVYQFDASPNENLLFIHYDLINQGTATLSNVYVGYFADTDVGRPISEFGESCQPLSYSDNSVGYDEARGMTYVYFNPHAPDAMGAQSSCLGNTAGYLFLDAPKDPAHPLAHTIIRRRSSDGPPGFYEGEMRDAVQVGKLLKGLSIDGDPMIDPTTGQETHYAFTGDPMEETGWLDSAVDVRNLLSEQPFSLAPGETKSVTLAWIIIEGKSDLESALDALKAQADVLRANPARYVD